MSKLTRTALKVYAPDIFQEVMGYQWAWIVSLGMDVKQIYREDEIDLAHFRSIA